MINIYCAEKNSINNKNAKKKAIVLAFLLGFIIAALFSEAFVLIHASHEHDHNAAGGGCSVCADIQNAENILKLLGMIICGASAVSAGLFAALMLPAPAFSQAGFASLVSLKVRMNN